MMVVDSAGEFVFVNIKHLPSGARLSTLVLARESKHSRVTGDVEHWRVMVEGGQKLLY